MNAPIPCPASAVWMVFLMRKSPVRPRRIWPGYGQVRAAPARMSLLVCIMSPKAGQPQWMMEANGMTDHNGVLMMQRVLLAGTLGLAMARKAPAILEGEPSRPAPLPVSEGTEPGFREPQGPAAP